MYIEIVSYSYAHHIFPKASLWRSSCAGRLWAGPSSTLPAVPRRRRAARRERYGRPAQSRVFRVFGWIFIVILDHF